MSAVESVPRANALATPEILELILLHLDIRTLLTSAQRNCRGWNSLIKASPSLQWALFFLPVQSSGDTSGGVVYNPLLMDAFPSAFPRPVGSQNEQMPFTFEDLDMVKIPVKKEPYLWKKASWRRMLVQQPPAKNISLFRLNHNRRDSFDQYTLERKANEGIRMETLFESLLYHDEISWERHAQTYLLWNHHDHLDCMSYRETEISDAFQDLLATTDIVIYVHYVVQYSWGPSPPTQRKKLRDMIARSYTSQDSNDSQDTSRPANEEMRSN